MVLLLTPAAFWSSRQEGQRSQQGRWKGLDTHPRAVALAVLLAGIAPLFGFTAIALGLVGYVTTLFKLSSVLTIIWARVFLGEGQELGPEIRRLLRDLPALLVGHVPYGLKEIRLSG